MGRSYSSESRRAVATADNIPISAGTGTTVATDDVAGIHYQRVKLVDGTLDGTGAIGGDAANGLDVDVTRLPVVQAQGTVANGIADSGNPQKVGGQARTTNPTPVTDGDRCNFITDKLGKQVVVGSIRILKGRQVTTITSSTVETTIVTAGGASVFLDLYGLMLTNTSGTATEVTVRDATAGGTISSFMVPAGDTRGFTLGESAAMTQGTANNNWTATCTTSVASLKVTALYVKNS